MSAVAGDFPREGEAVPLWPVVLADQRRWMLTAPPRRTAAGDWEMQVDGNPRQLRDRELCFIEQISAVAAPAGAAVPATVRLPDGTSFEGAIFRAQRRDGALWLNWQHDGQPREGRIAAELIERLTLSLRAPQVPLAAPRPAPTPAAAPVAAPASADLRKGRGFAELADGTRALYDVPPLRLSDGSWQLQIDGRMRIVPGPQLWLSESLTAPPVQLDALPVPLHLLIVLASGQPLEGEVLAMRDGEDAVWLRWRHDGEERSLWLASGAVAACEVQLRAATVKRAAPTVVENGRKAALLRSPADLDAYVAGRQQGEARAIECHFQTTFEDWQQIVGDPHLADAQFRLANRLGMPLVDLDAIEASSAAIAALAPDAARRLRVVPLRITPKLIVAATDNPSDVEAHTTVEFTTGRRLLSLIASPPAMHAAISRYYDTLEDSTLLRSLLLGQEADDDSDKAARENERLAREQPIVRLVSTLIDDAVARRTSDIHIRPGEDNFEVLYRIDGALLPIRTFARPLLRAVISRIKVIASMDIAEHRLPQDGRVTVISQGTLVDLRISVLPSVYGESVVMRLLNTRDGLRNIEQIGFNEHDEGQFRNMLSRSHGMVLVTGPTGCGKSTTLYAALLEARKQSVNIITVEDPVEYRIGGVTQIQINHGIGFDFARTLRNILRHDPDIIMVGEIRDHETAEIAVESALTGHIVLSTLHTNSAATAVTRLIDLGVEAFLLRSTLLGVLAQRLARRNCPNCLDVERVESYVRAALGVGEDEEFKRGIGCKYCAGTGVHGRIAVYELMPITAAMRRLIVANVDGDAVHDQAVVDGMIPITQQALALARAGTISLAEAYRIRVE